MFALINEKHMLYKSTNNISPALTLSNAASFCLAPDGGIYVPEGFSRLPRAFLNNLGDMTLREKAYAVLSAFNTGEFTAAQIKQMADYAFAADAPLKEVAKGVFVLELFHGPTLSFKDYGARFLSKLLELSAPMHRTVLVASVGNSGAATANGFSRHPDTDVLVLFPKGIPNRMTRAQFTGPNVHAVEIDGTIEDCKRLTRAAMIDPQLAECNLTAANSVNVGRFLPQTVFAFHAYGELLAAGVKNPERALYSMPCGNLSNLAASILATQLGLPVGGLIGACNINNPLGALISPDKQPTRPVKTLAPSMDVVHPSGMFRIQAMGAVDEIGKTIRVSDPISDEMITDTINTLRSETGYTIDPHGAAAFAALSGTDGSAPRVVYATAHPAKNLDIMTSITGQTIELPVQLTRFMNGKVNSRILPPTLPALRKFILNLKNNN